MVLRKIFAAAAAAVVVSVLAAGTAMAGEWKWSDYGTWQYKKDDGTLAAGEWIQDTDGKWYCFKKNGDMYKEIYTPDGCYVGADGAWIPGNDSLSAKAYDRVLTSAQYGVPGIYAEYSEDFWGNYAMTAHLIYGEPADPDYETTAYILVSPNAPVSYFYTRVDGDNYTYLTDHYTAQQWVTKRGGSIRMLNFTQDENGVITSFSDGDAG